MSRLFQVAPRTPCDDGTQLGRADPKHLGKIAAFDAHLAPVSRQLDLLFAQFGLWVAFAKQGTSFLAHVARVVSHRAKKQMVGTNAQRRIAGVAHEHGRVINRAVRQFVTGPMGVRGGAADPELSVAVGADSAAPDPTRIAVVALSDIAPKAFIGIGDLGRIGTCARAKAADLRLVIGDRRSACFAWSRYLFGASSFAGSVVALRTTKRGNFARSPLLDLATHATGAVNLRGVVLAVALVAFKECHICLS
jgi:hypothetical protein